MYIKSGKFTLNNKSKSTRCSKMSPVTETIIKIVMIVLYIYITVTIRTFSDISQYVFGTFPEYFLLPLWGADLVENGAGFPFNTKTGRWLFFHNKTWKTKPHAAVKSSTQRSPAHSYNSNAENTCNYWMSSFWTITTGTAGVVRFTVRAELLKRPSKLNPLLQLCSVCDSGDKWSDI